MNEGEDGSIFIDSVRVLTISWNMGNAMPESFEDLIPSRGKGIDLVVFGFQESTFTMKKEQPNVDPSPRKDVSVNSEEEEPRSRHSVEHVKRFQMQLIVYCRRELVNAITNVETSKENTGFLHLLPNKGGICVTLTLGQTSFAFISCHLAAHEGPLKCWQRNDSIAEILGGIKGMDKRFDPSLQCHHTILLGDLNYRLTYDHRLPTSHKVASDAKNAIPADEVESELSAKLKKDQLKEILEFIKASKWSDLLNLDELTREMAAGRVLDGFTALVPTFAPTFKRTRGKRITLEKRENKVYEYNHWHQKNIEASSIQIQGTREGSRRLPSVSLVLSNKKVSGDVDQRLPSPSSSILSEDSISLAVQSDSTASHVFDKDTKSVDDDDDDEQEKHHYYSYQRIPSYTDRVVYKSLPHFKENLQPLYFESCERMTTSDHKPVRALFDVKLTSGVYGVYVTRKILQRQAPTSRKSIMTPSSPRLSKTKGGVVPTSLRIDISHLAGSELAEMDLEVFGGLSDPFIIITADPPQIIPKDKHGDREIKSSTIYRSINPVWDETLSFDICTTDLAGLSANAHLFISVWDFDRSKSADLIGLLALPFHDIIAKCLEPDHYFSFDEPIYRQAMKQGTLKGTICVTPFAFGEGTARTRFRMRDILDSAAPESVLSGAEKYDANCSLASLAQETVGQGQCSPNVACAIQ